MTETKDTDEGDLFPPQHRHRSEFTEDEIEDILRFAKQHGIHGVEAVRLIAFIKDVRAAHASRRKAKGE